MSDVKVSVIIPCFNYGLTIERAIESVQAQTFKKFEIIVINDGSYDPHTINILKKISESGIKVLTKRNGGVSSARNLGIRHAKGQYLFSLDADDHIEPTLLEKGVEILDKNARTGIVTSGVNVKGVFNGSWMPKPGKLPELLAFCDIAPGSLFRHHCWEEAGGYDESFKGMEDYDLWLTILKNGWNIEVINEFLFNYNRSPTGLCSTVVNHNRQLHEKFFEKHRKDYEENALDVIVSLQLHQEYLHEVIENLKKSEASFSYRLGRTLTQPFKKLDPLYNYIRNLNLIVLTGAFTTPLPFFRKTLASKKQNYFDNVRMFWTKLRYAGIPRIIKKLLCRTTVRVPGIGKFSLEKGDSIGSFLYFFRVWEPYITNFAVSQLNPGDVFIDIGANFGYYSVLAGTRVGNQGRIYAFEPAPVIFNALENSIHANKITTCRALNVAASSSSESLPLYMGPPENSGATSHYHEELDQKQKRPPDAYVKAGPVSNFIDESDIARVKLIKIDTEGHEIEVLKGMRPLADKLQRSASILVEYSVSVTEDDPSRWEEILWWVNKGYRLFAIKNEYRVDFYLQAVPWQSNGITEVVDLRSEPSVQMDFILSKSDLTTVPALAQKNAFNWTHRQEHSRNRVSSSGKMFGGLSHSSTAASDPVPLQ